MKLFLLVGLFFATAVAQAGEFKGLTAANLMRALLALDLPTTTEAGVITVKIETADCDHDTGYNGAPDSPIWGLGRRSCTVGSTELSTKDSELLMRALGEACLPTDSAQGHWTATVTNLDCKIHLKELSHEKRFICTFDGEQPDALACASYF